YLDWEYGTPGCPVHFGQTNPVDFLVECHCWHNVPRPIFIWIEAQADHLPCFPPGFRFTALRGCLNWSAVERIVKVYRIGMPADIKRNIGADASTVICRRPDPASDHSVGRHWDFPIDIVAEAQITILAGCHKRTR